MLPGSPTQRTPVSLDQRDRGTPHPTQVLLMTDTEAAAWVAAVASFTSRGSGSGSVEGDTVSPLDIEQRDGR
jgi:hypothetical protein